MNWITISYTDEQLLDSIGCLVTVSAFRDNLDENKNYIASLDSWMHV